MQVSPFIGSIVRTNLCSLKDPSFTDRRMAVVDETAAKIPTAMARLESKTGVTLLWHGKCDIIFITKAFYSMVFNAMSGHFTSTAQFEEV